MLVKGGQGKTIILREGLVNKFYTASSCINKGLGINLLTVLLKTAVNDYTMVLRVRVCNI